MAERKEPALDDDRICALIDHGIGQSVGFSESKLSKERERVQLFYDGERPLKAHAGDSGYVSDDVWIGVESMKAQLLDVFAANARPVKFTPTSAEDVPAAKIRTDYVTHVIMDQNPGYEIMRDTIEEGLKSRAGICKVWWDVKSKWEYTELSDVAEQDLVQWLAQNPDVEVHEKETRAGDGAVFKRVSLKQRKDVSQARIKQLAGEEFGISPMAEDLETADLTFDRHEMTVSDLLKAGYDKDKVADLQSNDRLWLATEPEKIARFQGTDDMIGTKVLEDGQEARRTVMVYECYLELDIDGTKESQLFKVTKVGDTILDKEPVDEKPYIAFVPLPRPNAFWGANFAKRLEHIQTAKTYLQRSVVNHSLHTNNPKTLVRSGTLANPRELMENRFGGIVNVKDVNGVVPMQQSALNPFVLQVVQMLDQQKQELTGQSSLSQGLNPDAVSKQNSSDMVHELISVSQLRTKIVARNFAEGFLRPLYTRIYQLVLRNEDRKKIVAVSGQWVHVDPSQWPDECQAQVNFALGYGEADKEVAKWGTIVRAMTSDPTLAPWFTPQEHHYCATRALDAWGIADSAQVLRPLQSPIQPPPDPLHAAEVSMKNADAAAKNAQAQTSVQAQQLASQKMQNEHQLEMTKLQLEVKKLELEMAKIQQTGGQHDEKLQIEKDKLAHLVTVDAAEIALQYAAQQQDKLTANAEPKG
jgi:hypothetical protein